MCPECALILKCRSMRRSAVEVQTHDGAVVDPVIALRTDRGVCGSGGLSQRPPSILTAASWSHQWCLLASGRTLIELNRSARLTSLLALVTSSPTAAQEVVVAQETASS